MPDIAPTLLHLMGEGVPEHMDGRVVAEALVAEPTPMVVASDLAPNKPTSATPEEAAALRLRLERLGYL
jgi:arylsulfatase A-like enzyme